jgi:uncharacterized phage protein (TIGR02216 family)
MGLAFGVLGLTPDVFWAMTLKELAAAIRGRYGLSLTAPLARNDLDAMMQRFPDAAEHGDTNDGCAR